jgi:hypothetical protein
MIQAPHRRDRGGNSAFTWEQYLQIMNGFPRMPVVVHTLPADENKCHKSHVIIKSYDHGESEKNVS